MAMVTILILLFAMITSLGVGLRYLLKTPGEGDTGDTFIQSTGLPHWHMGGFIRLYSAGLKNGMDRAK